MIGLNDLLDSSSEENTTDEENNELDEANVFLKHLRKCFIASDLTSYCEYSFNPDLRVFDDQICKYKLLSDDRLRYVLSRRINADSYEYIRINKAKENPYTKHLNDSEALLENESTNPDLRHNSNSENASCERILFEKRTFEEVKENIKPSNSALSQMISKQPAFKNEFAFYSKFEAQNYQSQDPNSVQSLHIFLPMCDTNPTNNTTKTKKNFMQLKVYKSARISDLIGLVCYKYKNEKREPALRYNHVNGYQLKIADDTGEVETELSELESYNSVGKFGFSHLALIENSSFTPESNFNKKCYVKIFFADESPQMTLSFDSNNIQMINIFNEVLKSKLDQSKKFCPTIAYKMEHKDEPGVEIDLENATLNHFRTYDFFFYRLNSVRRDSSVLNSESSSPIDATRIIKESTEFNVEYLSKWQKVPFKIELSKDSFELEEIKPVQLSKLRLKVKNSSFYTIPMKFVVNCSIIKKNVSNKSQFRVIVAEEETDRGRLIVYKNLDFECSVEVAEKITAAFSHLMIYCNSPYVKQYNNLKKKQFTKWSRRLYKLKNKRQSFIAE